MDKTIISWDTLKSSATAGLNRIALPQNQSGEYLLAQLAWHSLKYKAGQQLQAPDSASTPAPDDHLIGLNRKSATALAKLIGQSNEDGIFELLALCQVHHRRISASLLPLFFDWAMRASISSEQVLSLVGERGKWLAGLHPDWQALLPLADSAWLEGNLNEQCIWLSQKRKTAPAEARDLLLSRLAQQANAKAQAQLISCLHIGLSQADETVLQEAYHHKRKEVRQNAALLLARLPNSEFVQNLIDFSAELWDYQQGFQIHLSDENVAVLKAFELGKIPLAQLQLGEKNRLLAQLMSVIPLSHWEEKLAMVPALLLNTIADNENADWLLSSWLMAAASQGRKDWALAMMDYLFSAAKEDSPELIVNWLHQLPDGYLPVLANLIIDQEWESLLKRHLQNLSDESSLGFWIRFIKLSKRELPSNIALAFGQRLVKIIARQYHPSFWLRQSLYHLPQMVQWFPTESYLRLAQLWATDPFEQFWQNEQQEAALKKLSFRYQLAKSFQSQ
ncbi:MAG: DUF5691 domain-containing protein [Bacteroidota bacterium]